MSGRAARRVRSTASSSRTHGRGGGPRAGVRARARGRRARPRRGLLPGRRRVRASTASRFDRLAGGFGFAELPGVRARRHALRLRLGQPGSATTAASCGSTSTARGDDLPRPPVLHERPRRLAGRPLALARRVARARARRVSTSRPARARRSSGSTAPSSTASRSPPTGGLLISCYRPDRIYHLDARRQPRVVAEDPQGTILGAPTNVCFVGRELDRVVAANLGRWHLTLLDLGLRGAPLHRPDRWAVDA